MPRLLLPLLCLTACRANGCAEGDTSDSEPLAETCAFSFAILTDTHIGEGIEDYGTAGWDDEPGGEEASASEALLEAAVATINAQVEDGEGPAFVVILGDLTDSAERSELLRARDLLAELEIPWLPLLGNHDTWPYAWDADQELWDEAPAGTGDALTLEIFEDAFVQAEADIPSLIRAPSVWNPDLDAESPFVSFAFDHCGVRFVALDSNTRTHAPDGYPGVGPEAALYDVQGAPWPWFIDDVTSGPGADAATVVVLAHHPFTQSTWTSFDEDAMSTMEADLQAHGLEDRIGAFFGGHLHMELQLEGPMGLPVVLADATKDGAGPRVVVVSEAGELDWSTED